jgi:uncharacterized protein YneF (UPF0154 family)
METILVMVMVVGGFLIGVAAGGAWVLRKVEREAKQRGKRRPIDELPEM